LFSYSLAHTPTVTGVEPAVAFVDTTLTITGVGFAPKKSLNRVTIGGAACDVSMANETALYCTVSSSVGTAGTFTPEVTVYNKGLALVNEGVTHTILMQIHSISPKNGSVLGGTTVTITGTGFARFGLFNEIKLKLIEPNTTANLLGPADRYDDDWLWGRGYMEGSNGTKLPPVTEVLCVPRTLRNRECAYTEDDSGYECTETILSAWEDIRVRGYARWFDYSSTTYIECVVEHLKQPVRIEGHGNAIADLNISIVNETTMLAEERLIADIEAAADNYDCETLSHCVKKDKYGVDDEWFSGTSGWDYSGATHGRENGFTFSANFTPRVVSVSPEYGMPGQLIEIRGTNLKHGTPVTDTNWYMSEFGFYYQPYTASVTIGSSECKLVSHNDTMITCHAVYGGMYKPFDVVVTVHGKGDAKVDANFTFGLNMYDVTPRQGSLAGGTVMTVTTSSLTDSKDLGVSSYSVEMIPNEEDGMSKVSE
jgi:hypothetical protein